MTAVTTDDQLRQAIVDSLSHIAPEIAPALIRPGIAFRDEFDLDSMDFLNFVLGLHERLGIDIPEADYPRLYTLDDAIAYLRERVAKAR